MALVGLVRVNGEALQVNPPGQCCGVLHPVVQRKDSERCSTGRGMLGVMFELPLWGIWFDIRNPPCFK